MLIPNDIQCLSSGSVEMPAGQVQCEGVLHPCWLHVGGSEPLPANPRPLLSGCDERLSLRSSASGIYSVSAVSQCNSTVSISVWYLLFMLSRRLGGVGVLKEVWCFQD